MHININAYLHVRVYTDNDDYELELLSDDELKKLHELETKKTNSMFNKENKIIDNLNNDVNNTLSIEEDDGFDAISHIVQVYYMLLSYLRTRASIYICIYIYISMHMHRYTFKNCI